MSSKMIPGRERPKDVCQFGVPFDKNGHPTWFQPVPSTATAAPVAPGLRVNNSLTGEKEEFVPLEGNNLTTASCESVVGPLRTLGVRKPLLRCRSSAPSRVTCAHE